MKILTPFSVLKNVVSDISRIEFVFPKKTQQAVENGFIGGCRDKFDSLVKFLDWSSNRRWTLSSDKDENGNGREGTQQSFMKLFLRPGSSCVGNVFFHCSWFVMLMIGIFWWYIF